MIMSALAAGRLYFDGGTGTVLQSMGLKPGELPETWNLSHPEQITALHSAYYDAGCDIVKTNTFGINRLKFPNWEELIRAGIACAKAAKAGRKNKWIAYDMGPTGQLLEPLGELAFEDAVSLFADNIRVAAACGVDLILIETMNDSYETKAAVLAAKESCDLPVFVTNVYDESGHLMTGADPAAMAALLEGLGADAIGINCSLGPDAMLPVVRELAYHTSLPLIANPNAGLPEVRDGQTVFTVDAESFSDSMCELARAGASVLGGCCGTTPDFIAKTVAKTHAIPLPQPAENRETLISSYTHAVAIGRSPVLIGERINPTGKPKFKQALRQNDLPYIVNEGLRQAEKGVQVLDVNVGLPEIDEEKIMTETVRLLQSVCDLPLQLDSTDPAVLEKAMRLYNGKPLINSVNGSRESMQAIFPLVKKYGGAVVALTLDEHGIPADSRQRLAIAQRICAEAARCGIAKKNLIVDPLALTVSSDANSARITLDTLKLLTENGFRTCLGVSNISFGLPRRERINAAFFANAMECGLSCAIMNPFSDDMMHMYYAFRVLNGMDPACADYIAYASEMPESKAAAAAGQPSDLKNAVLKGLKSEAEAAAGLLLADESPLSVIDGYIIPALNEIGAAFEQKKAYLPQLLMSAEAAAAAFEVIKQKIPAGEGSRAGTVILATVKGDIHDIGKNIVKVLLESYGFTVIDLGRDVSPEAVLAASVREQCLLVGLSALMTTTVPAMAETVRLLHDRVPGAAVVVGGAVLTQEYADRIHADFYAKDAMETVRFAERFYQKS